MRLLRCGSTNFGLQLWATMRYNIGNFISERLDNEPTMIQYPLIVASGLSLACQYVCCILETHSSSIIYIWAKKILLHENFFFFLGFHAWLFCPQKHAISKVMSTFKCPAFHRKKTLTKKWVLVCKEERKMGSA